jgi:hypothetical protein
MRPINEEFEADAAQILTERIARLRKAFDEALVSLAEPIVLPSRSLPAPGQDTFETLRRLLGAAGRGGGQRDFLHALLDAASSCYPRTVLFILRGPALVRWESRSINGHDGAAAGISGDLAIPSRGDHLLAHAIDAGVLQVAGPDGPGFVITEGLGGLVPSRSAALPLLVRGRAVAVLYGDNAGAGSVVSEAGFEIIGCIGSMTLETLAGSRRGRPVPASPAVGAGHPEAIVPGSSAARGSALLAAPQPGLDFPAAAPLDNEEHPPESAHETVSLSRLEPDAPVVSPAMHTPPEDAEMQALLGDIDGMPRRESADDGFTPEERRLHQDARRFASLLVSELLLYNEEAVILGRRHKDLAHRLGREIEKSRQAYTTRVPSHLRGASRYLDDEIVRVLAEGDSGVLGN